MSDSRGPDDICLVCGEVRDQHGDKNHQFNDKDDQLVPLKQGPARRQNPPQERPKTLSASDVEGKGTATPADRALATLVEVLTEKNILTTADVIRVFQGHG